MANRVPLNKSSGGSGHGDDGGLKSKRTRHRQKHAAAHEEAAPVHDESNWLVSYADMMTLLFGFFVLMYSFSKIDEKKFEIVRKEVARYFGGQIKSNPAAKKAEKEIDEALSQAGIDKSIQLIARDSMLELRFNGSFHFVPGTATLTKESQFILGKLIDTIKRTIKADSIIVDGHTDDDPIASEKFPSNWELSSSRAAAVVREFERFGFDPTKMTATGYGSSRPILPNRDSKGSPLLENQEANRRVIVNVVFSRDVDDAVRAMKTNQFTSTDTPENLPDKSRTSLVQDGEGEPTWREKVTHDLGAVQEKVKLAEERLKESEARKNSARQLSEMQNRLKQVESRIDTSETETKKYVDQTDASKKQARVPATTKKVKTKAKSKLKTKKKAKAPPIAPGQAQAQTQAPAPAKVSTPLPAKTQ